MQMICNRYMLFALCVALSAVFLDYKATTFPLTSKSISITQSGQAVSKDIIETPTRARVCL